MAPSQPVKEMKIKFTWATDISGIQITLGMLPLPKDHSRGLMPYIILLMYVYIKEWNLYWVLLLCHTPKCWVAEFEDIQGVLEIVANGKLNIILHLG